MARLKTCPVCGGKHRKKAAFKRCYLRSKPAKWSPKEIGMSGRK